VIVWSLVFSQYQHVTDRQTNTPHMSVSRSNIAERDKNETSVSESETDRDETETFTNFHETDTIPIYFKIGRDRLETENF